MRSLVSIIVPVYNCEDYLERCLDSLTKQTYRDIEIIVVDDGSRDNSYNIAKNYFLKDKRINLYHRENCGVSATRNFALDCAHGDFICFVDADDYVSNIFIEVLLSNLLKENADLSICGFCVSATSHAVFDVKNAKPLERYTVEETLLQCYKTRKTGVCVWGKLYKKAIISDLRFDTTLRLGEDQVYFVESLKKSKLIVYQDVKLYCYFKNQNSAMRSQVDDRFLDCIAVGEYFRKAGLEFPIDKVELFNKIEIFSYIPTYIICAKCGNEASQKIKRMLLPRIQCSNPRKILRYCNRKDSFRYLMVRYFPRITWLIFRIRGNS